MKNGDDEFFGHVVFDWIGFVGAIVGGDCNSDLCKGESRIYFRDVLVAGEIDGACGPEVDENVVVVKFDGIINDGC